MWKEKQLEAVKKCLGLFFDTWGLFTSPGFEVQRKRHQQHWYSQCTHSSNQGFLPPHHAYCGDAQRHTQGRMLNGYKLLDVQFNMVVLRSLEWDDVISSHAQSSPVTTCYNCPVEIWLFCSVIKRTGLSCHIPKYLLASDFTYFPWMFSPKMMHEFLIVKLRQKRTLYWYFFYIFFFWCLWNLVWLGLLLIKGNLGNWGNKIFVSKNAESTNTT